MSRRHASSGRHLPDAFNLRLPDALNLLLQGQHLSSRLCPRSRM